MLKYTAAEVKCYLRGKGEGERTQPIMEEASNFSTYTTGKLPEGLLGRERIFERLPSVLYQYNQGRPTAEIARSIGYLTDGEDVEAAMDYVAELIARRVNNRDKKSFWVASLFNRFSSR